MTDLDEVRLGIVRAHGLPDDATRFLDATTVDALEHQAEQLAKVIGTAQVEQAEPLTDVITRSLADKHHRRRALIDALHGQPTQEAVRDEHGRYASPSARGFDGGARTPAPAPRNPQADHDALIGRLAEVSRTFRHGL